MNDKENLSYLFLLMLLPCVNQSLRLKVMTQKKRERKIKPQFLFLSVLPKSKEDSVGKMYK